VSFSYWYKIEPGLIEGTSHSGTTKTKEEKTTKHPKSNLLKVNLFKNLNKPSNSDPEDQEYLRRHVKLDINSLKIKLNPGDFNEFSDSFNLRYILLNDRILIPDNTPLDRT
jgi:hypothetical protein